MKKTDIVVIGAGIAGITAAIYLKRANADFIILEGMLPGGKLNQLKTIENYPGYQKISGSDLQIKLLEQLRNLDVKITYGQVQSILKEDGGFEVVTDVDSIDAKAIIVASGLSSKSEMIKGEKEYFGMGVSYCATCDGNFFKNQDIAVLGNNDIALEEALYLSGLAKHVYILVPDEEIQGDSNLINKVNSSKNIEIKISEKAVEIAGDQFGVTSVKTTKNEYKVNGVFPYTGKKTSTEFLSGLHPDSNNFALKVDNQMKTNIDGLYAAGDIVDKTLRQLVTSANDGAIAATNAIIFVKQIHL